MDEARICMIEQCHAEPDEYVVVNDEGIVLAYAICAQHFSAVQRGDLVRFSTKTVRGLLGLYIQESA